MVTHVRKRCMPSPQDNPTGVYGKQHLRSPLLSPLTQTFKVERPVFDCTAVVFTHTPTFLPLRCRWCMRAVTLAMRLWSTTASRGSCQLPSRQMKTCSRCVWVGVSEVQTAE